MHQTEEVLFRNWHWGECIEFLDNTIQHSNAIMLVSSVPDSGKTSLKQELINSLNKQFKIFSMYADPRLGVASLMRQVTLGFDLPWDHNVPPDWSEIKKAIFSQTECRLVLCIDDAEKLSWDALNALINLYSTVNAEGSQFSLILFADLNLEDSLKNSVLKDFFENKFQIIHLKTLTLEQMTFFVRDHLGLPLNRKALKRIHNASNGIIGKVKQLAISELSQKTTKENILITSLLKNITKPPAIQITVCCSLLVVAYLLFSITQKKDDTFAKEDEIQLIAQKNITLTPASTVSLSEGSNGKTIKETSLPSVTISNNQFSDPQKYEQLYQQLYMELTNSLQKQFQAKMQEELVKLEKKIAALTPIITTPSVINGIEENEKNTVNEAATNNTEQIEKPIIEAKSINNKIAKANNSSNTNLAIKYNTYKPSEKHLLKIAKNRYVLQLMTTKDEQSIQKLIAAHPKLSNKIKYFSAQLKPNKKGQVWFVAVHGSYANKQLAINDIKKLPKELQKLKPIVRNYGYVHKLINDQTRK